MILHFFLFSFGSSSEELGAVARPGFNGLFLGSRAGDFAAGGTGVQSASTAFFRRLATFGGAFDFAASFAGFNFFLSLRRTT